MKVQLEDGTGLDLKYLVKDTDRHGTVRVYVRKHGRKVRIRDLASVEEFMAAYRAALELRDTVSPSSSTAPAPGSLRWLVQAYYGCPEYLKLHESTRAQRRSVLDGICLEHGAKPFANQRTVITSDQGRQHGDRNAVDDRHTPPHDRSVDAHHGRRMFLAAKVL